MARYFTPEEVNDILPVVSPLVGEVLERRARVVLALEDDQVKRVLSDEPSSNVGNRAASKLVKEFEKIELLIDKIQSHGCHIKDLNGGLIDFLARRRGREVFLCWRYGEPLQIEYYHELHTGFAGRRTIDSADFSS